VYSEEVLVRTLLQPDVFIGTYHGRDRVAWSVVEAEIERIEVELFEELESRRLLTKYLTLNPRGRMATLSRHRLAMTDTREHLSQGVL
jgi:hypothetical protein